MELSGKGVIVDDLEVVIPVSRWSRSKKVLDDTDLLAGLESQDGPDENGNPGIPSESSETPCGLQPASGTDSTQVPTPGKYAITPLANYPDLIGEPGQLYRLTGSIAVEEPPGTPPSSIYLGRVRVDSDLGWAGVIWNVSPGEWHSFTVDIPVAVEGGVFDLTLDAHLFGGEDNPPGSEEESGKVCLDGLKLVGPAPRTCGCSSPGAPSGAGLGLGLLLVFAVRRRRL